MYLTVFAQYRNHFGLEDFEKMMKEDHDRIVRKLNVDGIPAEIKRCLTNILYKYTSTKKLPYTRQSNLQV